MSENVKYSALSGAKRHLRHASPSCSLHPCSCFYSLVCHFLFWLSEAESKKKKKGCWQQKYPVGRENLAEQHAGNSVRNLCMCVCVIDSVEQRNPRTSPKETTAFISFVSLCLCFSLSPTDTQTSWTPTLTHTHTHKSV